MYPASAPPVADVSQHNAVAELLERRPDLIKTTATCIICNQNRSEVLGVFVWNNRHSKALGVTENFPERRFLYGMCERCFEHPTKGEILAAVEYMFVQHKGQPASEFAHELKTRQEIYAYLAGVAACASIVFGRAITAPEAQACLAGMSADHARRVLEGLDDWGVVRATERPNGITEYPLVRPVGVPPR